MDNSPIISASSLNRAAFRFPTPGKQMPSTGERYVSGLFGDIQSEHYHRYLLALRYAERLDVLDVASGEGFGSALLGQVARSVVGVDVDPNAVSFANENYLTERVSFRRGDALALPIADRSVDTVVSFETIEHLTDHEGFLAEILRVLRPGGQLVISSPDQKVYSGGGETRNPFHSRELGRGEFLRLLQTHFEHVILLEQRALTGSVIMRASETCDLGTVEGFSSQDGLLFERGNGVPSSPYLIAVVSNNALPSVPHSVMHTPRGIWYIEELRQRAEKHATDADVEVARLSKALAEVVTERDRLSNEVGSLSLKLQDALADRDRLSNEVGSLSLKLQDALADRDRVSNEVGRLSLELRHALADRDLRRNEADQSRNGIAKLSVQLSEAQAEVKRLQVEVRDTKIAFQRVVESTTWQASRPLREVLANYPSAARLTRRSLRVAKWIFTGQLRSRLDERRERLALWEEAAALTRDCAIDASWYLSAYPDVALGGHDPAWHYVALGRAEGRHPLPPRSPLPTVQATHARPSVRQLDPPAMADGCREWLTYAPMAQRIAADRARQLEEVRPARMTMISLEGADLSEVASGLNFKHEASPVVSIVVPVFNNLQLTLECLSSLLRYTDHCVPYEVILADDASTDASPEVLPTIRNVTFARNSVNLGFLMNSNGAVRRARGEFVLFLNNDVQVTPGWLPPLLAAFSLRDDVGAVGPRIVYPSGHLQEAGVLVNRDCSADLIGLNDDPAKARYSFARRVDYCSGACLLVRKDVFAEIGGFSEALQPAYCEDLDLALKLRERGLATWFVPESVVVHHLSRTLDRLGQNYKMRCIVANQQKISERWQTDVDAMNRVRLFAFYLPQYHRIAENDRWWGRGFTDWTNVTRGVPLYDGHGQPQLPADLGFYDLCRPDVLCEQASLALRYGIEGFCFYYYWFNGKRLLEAPLEAMLASSTPDFPFLLCWANENWTRRWDGREQEILVSQSHSDEDDAAVIRDLMRYFRDPRYVRVDGRPMLLIYRVELFPNFAFTAATWRSLCRAEGIGEIYLAMVSSFDKSNEAASAHRFGCDAVVQFPPHGDAAPVGGLPAGIHADFTGAIFDYEASAVNFLRLPIPPSPFFPAVMPSWDNTARRAVQAHIFHGATPGAFQAWLEAAIRLTREHNVGDERIVFVNAWNEWAEGAHLEPDRIFGHANLEAVRNALLYSASATR